MSKQYKDHPFVQALQVIAPVIVPSFEVVSMRDNEGTIFNGPIMEYVISSVTNKVYDKSKNKFRSTYNIILGLSVLESKTPLFWCEYDELKDAKDRQGLFHRMDGILEDFLIWLINPEAASPSIYSNSDTLYAKYDFQLVSFNGGAFYSKSKTKQSMTGLAIDFNISCITGEGTICCSDDGTKEAAEIIQPITKPNSNSYKLLQNRIDL